MTRRTASTVEVTSAPTLSPAGLCLLACNGLINLDFEDIYHTYDTTKSVTAAAMGHGKSGSDWGRKLR